MQTYEKYQEAKRRHQQARSWVELRKDRDSQDGKPFGLSPSHSKVMLMRCGQHSAGAKNYHESPEPFNSALLIVIKNEFDRLAESALALLAELERKALVDCESELTALQAGILAAKG